MYPVNLTKTVISTNETENISLNDAELQKIVLFLIGNLQHFRENIIIPRTIGSVQIKTNEEKKIERIMESCVFKSTMSCILGIFSDILYCTYNMYKYIMYKYIKQIQIPNVTKINEN